MRIVRAQVVSTFEHDSGILLSCGPKIRHLCSEYKGKLLQIGTPDDAPSSAPRAVLVFEDANLNIAHERFSLSLQIPSQISNYIEKVSTYVQAHVDNLLRDLLEIAPVYCWCGTIFNLQFLEEPLVSANSNEAIRPLFDKLINIGLRNEKLATFELKVGYESQGYFYNYAISGFEIRKMAGLLPMPDEGVVKIDAELMNLEGCGIEVVQDINNRKVEEKNSAIQDIQSLLEMQVESAESVVERLNLEDVV